MNKVNKMKKNDLYVDSKQCNELGKQQSIYIFGTGVDAEELRRELSDEINILAYIDNNRYGDDYIFYGKRIISFSEYLKQKKKGEIVIVASYRFGKEMCKQLSDNGLIPGKDFYMWDEKHLFHFDTDTKNLVQFLKKLWGSKKRTNTANKILVAFDNRHEILPIMYAYCSNYFAEKFDAAIFGYLRGGADSSNASEIMKEIYHAFNMEDIVDTTMNDMQEKEADKICEDLWKTLYTWEDWKNISVYGIDFGTTIIRHFLRMEIPCFDLREEKMHRFLNKAIKTIVFWYHYINSNNIKTVLLADGVQWDGYIRDIAITKGIPTYAIGYKMERLKLNYTSKSECYDFFGEFWEKLEPQEQVYGLNWAKEHIEKRLQGSVDEVWTAHKKIYTFAEERKEYRILEENDKIKIIIFPHIFEEDCFWCGEQIFDNNYFSWLCHLGELSNRMENYDWYLKMHPNAQRRDIIIIDQLLKKYTNIKRIPSNVSPIQLKEEGAKFALTNHGTIGHELPEIGIQVINAGRNPHSQYNFTWNPKNKEEYDNLIYNLDKLEKKIDFAELYKFYCLNYLFYNWNYVDYKTFFFNDPLIGRDLGELKAVGIKNGTWIYRDYMNQWDIDKHNFIMSNMEDTFKKIDEWRPDVFYKKAINMQSEN